MGKASGIILLILLGSVHMAFADQAVPASESAGESTVVQGTVVPGGMGPCSGDCGCDCHGCGGSCETCSPCSGTLEFFGPLAIINQHPPTMLFLTPVPERARVLPQGGSYIRFSLTHANNLIRELDAGIIADYDFETLRGGLDYHTRLGDGELGVGVPYIHRGHGILDNLIADWHGWFGLPNGNRDKFADYMYRYTISTRRGLVFNDDGDSNGVGDVTVTYKHPVHESANSASAVRVGAKLPTGDPDKAMGSGNIDYQVGALYEGKFGSRLAGYLNVDWVMVGEPDWENVGYQDSLVTLWALEYSYDASTTLVTQYRTERNPLKIGSREADKDAQEFAIGLNRRLSEDMVWSWGFNEDLNPETSPDFVLYTDIKWEF